MSDQKQKNKLHHSIINDEYVAIKKILNAKTTGRSDLPIDINGTDETGCSALFLALAHGYMKKQPEIIKQLLNLGAVIKNGKILKPAHFPKLITRYANARNLQYIFKKYFEFNREFKPGDLVLEIGSGDGYLKYLLGLCNDMIMDNLKNRMLESEPAKELVFDAGERGKTMIRAGIEELDEYFITGSFSLILSMNVLDILEDKELKRAAKIIYQMLRKNGMLIHIMSSAVHKNVFCNIKSLYQKYLMLPYYKDGYVGVRLVRTKSGSRSLMFSSSSESPEELAELFARKPEKYIELADKFTSVFKDAEDSCILILLRDFSIWRMTRALSQAGFSLLCCEEVSSNTVVDANSCHANLPGYNSFTNVMGSLITEVNHTIDEGKVDEKSIFIYLMAQRG